VQTEENKPDNQLLLRSSWSSLE